MTKKEKKNPRLLLGSKFGKLLTVKASEEMREYTKRKGLESNLSGAEWIRRKLFPNDWLNELEILRKMQSKKGV